MWPSSRTQLPAVVDLRTYLPAAVNTTRDGLIRFDWNYEGEPSYAPMLDYEALHRFRRLGAGRDGADKATRIAKFAARYGPLCLPTTTDLKERPSHESVSTWRCWARTTEAIMRICLRDPSPRASDFEHLRDAFSDSGLFPENQRQRASRPDGATVPSWAATRDAGRCLARWLNFAQVRVEFSWHEASPAPRWSVSSVGLLGALALGTIEVLRLNVTEEARLRGEEFEAACFHCGTAFRYGGKTGRRKPAPGRRCFCDDCRNLKMPQKYRDADHSSRRLDLRRRERQLDHPTSYGGCAP
jgi:hypothetical protein